MLRQQNILYCTTSLVHAGAALETVEPRRTALFLILKSLDGRNASNLNQLREETRELQSGCVFKCNYLKEYLFITRTFQFLMH